MFCFWLRQMLCHKNVFFFKNDIFISLLSSFFSKGLENEVPALEAGEKRPCIYLFTYLFFVISEVARFYLWTLAILPSLIGLVWLEVVRKTPQKTELPTGGWGDQN